MDARDQSLKIRHLRHLLGELTPDRMVCVKRVNGVETFVYACSVGERVANPLFKEPLPEGRYAAVEEGEEGSFRSAVVGVVEDFEEIGRASCRERVF